MALNISKRRWNGMLSSWMKSYLHKRNCINLFCWLLILPIFSFFALFFKCIFIKWRKFEFCDVSNKLWKCIFIYTLVLFKYCIKFTWPACAREVNIMMTDGIKWIFMPGFVYNSKLPLNSLKRSAVSRVIQWIAEIHSEDRLKL